MNGNSSTDETPAGSVLAAVLSGLVGHRAQVEPVASWIEGEDVLCIVYRSSYVDGIVGLRRVIELDVPLDAVVSDILEGDFGEPMGSDAEHIWLDDEGRRWWSGLRPEWRYEANSARARSLRGDARG